jgi:hypothetical protein
METRRKRYNLLVKIGKEEVLRTEDTRINRIRIKEMFKEFKYKLIKT